jgi:hypothetical protein
LNKTNVINKTIISYKTNYINKIRWNNKTNYINKIRWNNKTIIISNQDNTNNYKYLFCENNTETDEESENSIIFGLTNQEIVVLSGSIGGIAFLFCMFYISWEYCGLKDKLSSYLQNMILDYCCCGMGEYFLCILDIIGCINMVQGDEEEQETAVENTRTFVRQATKEVVDEIHKKTDGLTLEITEPNNLIFHHKEVITPGGTIHRRKCIEV